MTTTNTIIVKKVTNAKDDNWRWRDRTNFTPEKIGTQKISENLMNSLNEIANSFRNRVGQWVIEDCVTKTKSNQSVNFADLDSLVRFDEFSEIYYAEKIIPEDKNFNLTPCRVIGKTKTNVYVYFYTNCDYLNENNKKGSETCESFISFTDTWSLFHKYCLDKKAIDILCARGNGCMVLRELKMDY